MNANKVTGEIILPELPALTNAISAFSGASKINIIRFTGNCEAAGVDMTTVCSNNTDLTEFEFPRKLNMINSTGGFGGCGKLKKIIMPLEFSYNYPAAGTGWYHGFAGATALEEFTRANEATGNKWSNSNTLYLYFQNTRRMKTFWHPECNTHCFNYAPNHSAAAPGMLESLELDWSAFYTTTEGSGSIQIIIKYNNFSTAELNRIYTAVPDLTPLGKTGWINASGNPGYAASNRAIANAKGWTVT
jgi:hypothetical protein